MQTRERTFYQYALLSLAVLQADFGCNAEAIAAIREAISSARENKDMECLNYSLSWLYHFGKAHPGEIREVQGSGLLGSEKETLHFLKAKAKETNMWSLLSTSLLSEAKFAIASVSRSIPQNIFFFLIDQPLCRAIAWLWRLRTLHERFTSM
jgi:anaphase-promoting complex subunit 5